MFARVKKVFRGRAARKLGRNRLALAGLSVIAVYFIIGLYVFTADTLLTLGRRTGWFDLSRSPLVTALTLEKVEAVVGPLGQPGWLQPPRPEQRMQAAKNYLDEFRKALRVKDKERALEALRFGERRIGKSPDEIKAIYDDAKAQYDELNKSDDLDKDPSAAAAIGRLEQTIDAAFAPLSRVERLLSDFRVSLGTDRQGRSIAARAVYSIRVAIQIGLVVAVISVVLGSVIGAAAGYFGGWVDGLVTWLFSTLQSVPDLVLLAVLAFMFTGSIFDDISKPFLSLIPVYTAMSLTFWIGPCRVVRGETMKLKELEYVQAATAIGFSKWYILIRHILPNTIHLAFINFSLLFIAAIKFEVVLSFLGLGVKVGPSWGRMIQDSTQEVINGKFWQIGAATAFMFVLVLAFNIVSDALQDAFDPKAV